MKVVHIEMPRIFTLSVKEYMTEAAGVLERGGHRFEQYDINPNFWKWVLGLSTPHSPGDLFEPLLAAGSGEKLWGLLTELKGHLRDVSRLYGMPVGLRGIELEKATADSSYAMCSLVADNYGCGLFSNFFAQLEGKLRFRDADVISFGVESQEGIFWALQLASWLKSAGSAAHLCIGKHAWENFSLLPHVEDLAKNPWFFGVMDSVILYQEEMAETLGGLVAVLAGGVEEGLANIAIKRGEMVRVIQPRQEKRTELRVSKTGYAIRRRYFEAMEVPAERLVYSVAMVRNKCFYKKCTFCVQIAKHISDHAYGEAAEIERALNACEELERHGVTLVNFMDEAMRPVDLRDFCAGVQKRGLKFHWVGRMIAAANPNKEILWMMKEAGCTEILFGLETFDPRLSADMGKVSKSHDNAAETAAMIESFLEAGLFVILSMIYEFPTERAESRRKTLESIEGLLAKSGRFAMIFNRFHLLHESEIYKKPEMFNIGRVEARVAENDLQYHFGYECREERGRATAEELALMDRLRLGLCAKDYGELTQRYGRDLLEMAYFLDYVSMGFQYRVTHDATLLADLFSGRQAANVQAFVTPQQGR